MLVKHKFLSKQFEGQSHYKESIRRIVSVHHVEPRLIKTYVLTMRQAVVK
jgi:hypothetical protein